MSLLVSSQFLFGSIDTVVDQAYFRARRWTDEVSFAEAREVHAIAAMVRQPAVLRAEPFRHVAAYLRAHARTERIVVLGLEENAELERPLDPRGNRIRFKGQASFSRRHSPGGSACRLVTWPNSRSLKDGGPVPCWRCRPSTRTTGD